MNAAGHRLYLVAHVGGYSRIEALVEEFKEGVNVGDDSWKRALTDLHAALKALAKPSPGDAAASGAVSGAKMAYVEFLMAQKPGDSARLKESLKRLNEFAALDDLPVSRLAWITWRSHSGAGACRRFSRPPRRPTRRLCPYRGTGRRGASASHECQGDPGIGRPNRIWDIGTARDAAPHQLMEAGKARVAGGLTHHLGRTNRATEIMHVPSGVGWLPGQASCPNAGWTFDHSPSGPGGPTTYAAAASAAHATAPLLRRR